MAQQASLAKLLSTHLLSSHMLGFQYGCFLPESQVQELFHLRAYFCLLNLAGLFQLSGARALCGSCPQPLHCK